MSTLTTKQYDLLEDAIAHRRRIAIVRGPHELVIVPLRLRTTKGRELLDARHPTTGDDMIIALDDVLAIEAVR
jgi:hypothetical protein